MLPLEDAELAARTPVAAKSDIGTRPENAGAPGKHDCEEIGGFRDVPAPCLGRIAAAEGGFVSRKNIGFRLNIGRSAGHEKCPIDRPGAREFIGTVILGANAGAIQPSSRHIRHN